MTNFAGNAALPDVLYDIGGKYHSAGKFEQAKELYQRIVAGYPDTKYSLRAQRALVRLLSAAGKENEAKSAINQMTTDFSSDANQLTQSLADLARSAESRGQYEKAMEIYRQIGEITNDVNHANFESAKMGVLLLFDKDDEPNVLAQLDSLIAEYPKETKLPDFIIELAMKYDEKNKNDPNDFTRVLCQKVTEHFPSSPKAFLSRMIISRMDIISLIRANNEPNAIESVDKFVADYNDMAEDAGMNLCIIAEKFYGKAMRSKTGIGLNAYNTDLFHKAVYVWQRVQKDIPASIYTAQAYFCPAVIYCQELGEYTKGVEYYQKVVNSWPECRYSPLSQYLTGFYYRKLKDTGGLSQSEADEKIWQTYTTLIEKYPQSEQAKYAAYELAQGNFDRGNWGEAAVYFELTVQKSHENNDLKGLAQITYRLAQSYENSGEIDSAIRVCKELLSMSDPNDSQTQAILSKLQALQGEEK